MPTDAEFKAAVMEVASEMIGDAITRFRNEQPGEDPALGGLTIIVRFHGVAYHVVTTEGAPKLVAMMTEVAAKFPSGKVAGRHIPNVESILSRAQRRAKWFQPPKPQ